MDEYISRKGAVDELQEKVFHNLTDEYYGTMQVLNELPAANVAPVVRCRDCKYWCNGDVIVGCYWDVDGGQPEEMDFCSRGERKE